MRNLALALLTLLILAACDRPITATVTPAPSETAQDATGTQTPQPKPTDTLKPTETDRPTNTPLPTDTATPTWTPTDTITPTQTATLTPSPTLTPSATEGRITTPEPDECDTQYEVWHNPDEDDYLVRVRVDGDWLLLGMLRDDIPADYPLTWQRVPYPDALVIGTRVAPFYSDLMVNPCACVPSALTRYAVVGDTRILDTYENPGLDAPTRVSQFEFMYYTWSDTTTPVTLDGYTWTHIINPPGWVIVDDNFTPAMSGIDVCTEDIPPTPTQESPTLEALATLEAPWNTERIGYATDNLNVREGCGLEYPVIVTMPKTTLFGFDRDAAFVDNPRGCYPPSVALHCITTVIQ